MIKQLFRFSSDSEFRTRSKERDADTDNESIMSIAAAIEAALNRADLDDYLTRAEDRSTMLNNSDAEIRRGEERLKVLDQNIKHVKFLETARRTRFPDLKTKRA